MKLENINAIVSGGSSGLGKATVEIILNNGECNNFDTQKDKGEAFAKASGDRCNFLLTDVTNEKIVYENLSYVSENVGPINLAVSCAGIGIPEKIIVKKVFIQQ